MGEGSQKKKKYESVRIWTKQKERLENVLHQKAIKEKRKVTEVALCSTAIDALCAKEEKKLGI